MLVQFQPIAFFYKKGKIMRNGGIGTGWAPEQEQDEIQFLVNNLLKSKLDEIFQKIQENHKKGIQMGVSGRRLAYWEKY